MIYFLKKLNKADKFLATMIKKRKKEITNAETKKGEIIANPTITKMIRERCSNFLPIILKL